MAEETIWRGTASQLKNLGCFIFCAILCVLPIPIFFVLRRFLEGRSQVYETVMLCVLVGWLIVPIFIGLRRFLETRSEMYELTTERVKMSRGVFSKVTETLELYRVKDIETLQPFIYRMVGLENIKVNTSDLSSPLILIDGLPQSVGFADKLRNQVEIIRAQKNVRELDIE